MASYTYTQLYGSGSIGETISSGVEKVFTFTNPSGSSYFTMETIPTSSGFYEASSPKNFSGSFIVSASMGLVTSSYIASIVVQPGTQSFKFTPAITVTGTTYRLRGTGGYSLEISSGGGSAPVNIAGPEVTFNNLYVGGILTTTNGTWTGSPTFTYQWYNVSEGEQIAGATNNTYTLLTADAGDEINCILTATNAAGSTITNSNNINSLPLAAPTIDTEPFIDNEETYYVGNTIEILDNTWNGNPLPTLTYQWRRGNANITGATNNTYDATETDEERTILVRCTATNSQGTDFSDSNGVYINP